jgi:flavin-dependent dehydrogenase
VAVADLPGRQSSRAEILSPLVQPVLHELGLWRDFLGLGFARSHHTLTAWGEAALQSREWLLDARGSGWCVDRSRFDAWIGDAACGTATKVPGRVADLERQADGWSVDCGAGGRHSARLVIDATGRTNMVASLQGWRAVVQDRLVGAYAEAAGSDQANPEFLVEAFEDGWWYSMAVGEGRRAFVCMTDADIAHDLRLHTLSGWREALAKTQFTAAFAGRFQRFDAPRLLPAGGRSAAMPAGFRFLCAGDAAAAFDPISGHGVAKAMRSGLFAAYAAADCLLRRDGAALGRYGAWIARETAAYEESLRDHYGSEPRWAERPFWRRRL